jgi:hypothetical protein
MKVKSPKDKHITLRITMAKYIRMKALCKKYDMTLSDFVNGAIDERLEPNIIHFMKEKGIYFDKENKKRYEKRTETE